MYWILFERLFLEALLDVVYFPLWWYTHGLMYASKSCLAWLERANMRLAPGLWLKNIFVPMYGQRDFTGKVISFVIRFFQVIVRSLVLGLFAVGCIFGVSLWVTLPFIVVLGLILPFLG
jgi:hypothetical protein